MTTLRLTKADWEGTHKNTTYFTLLYIQGRDEATVDVELTDGEAEASCRELYADSHMDELELEEHAETWAEEHGDTLGEVSR